MKNIKTFSSTTKKSVALTLVFFLTFSIFALSSNESYSVKAAPNPYGNFYNIVDAVNYAVKWVNGSNPDYKSINKWANPNCASFVSECLTAGGIKINKAYRKLKGVKYEYYNTEWSVANNQYKYLKNQGYYCEKATDTTIHIGDVVYYDWKNSSSTDVDHAAYCIGVNSNNKPVIAEHSGRGVRIWNSTNSTIRNAYVIHMTNAVGHVDVTNKFIGKSINIKSRKNNRYVSSDTDNASATNTIAIANRTSVGGWEQFKVIKNSSINSSGGTTNSISLKTYAGRYLSAFICDDGTPVRNTGNISTWEAFRIFNQGSDYYLLSMINGKFVQVRDDNKLYVAGEGGWSWESYDIRQNTSATSAKTYTIQSNSGAKVRSGAGLSYSQKGALAKGSVVYYDQTKTANGYTWYHITQVSAKSGSWGSYVGYWVANV